MCLTGSDMELLSYAFKQQNAWTCGPAIARIILSCYGHQPTIPELTKKLRTTRSGTSHNSILKLFKKRDLRFSVKENSSLGDIKKHIKTHHLIVAYYIPRNREYHYSIVKKINSKRIYFHDTWFGSSHSYSLAHFEKNWKDDEAIRWMIAIKK